MTRALRTVLTTAGILALSAAVQAQSTTGRISGSVADAQGGMLQGATVVVTEVRTGFTRTATADSQGHYVFVSLPLGDYTVTAEQQGFKKQIKSGYSLVADGRLTADFKLEVGGLTEVVAVTVQGETVNTVSGEISRTVDSQQVQSLALNGRNYMQLATLVPGAPVLDMNALDIMTGLGINTSINGSRANASLLTVDGGFNMDGGSNNSQISNVGIDFIEEVSIKTANFSAEYGRNSGAAINVVTRGGTNTFHGSAFEYHRNDALDANSWFNNARKVERPDLKYNNFGGTLGGPLLKDKLFFFVGVEWKQIDRFTSPSLQTLPDSRMRNGDFGELSTPIIDPTTGKPFPGNVIPSDRITTDGRAIANLYGRMAGVANSYTDTTSANNALFQMSNPFRYREEMVRLDYNINDAHRLTGRLLLDHYSLTDPYGTFIGGSLPTVPTDRERPGRNVQLNYHWTIASNLLNEAKFNYSGNSQKIVPVGDYWARSAYGFQYPQLYSAGGSYEDAIPIGAVAGYAGWNSANGALISPTKDFAFEDNLTLLSGSHAAKAGVLFLYNEKKQNGRSQYTGNVGFATAGNPHTTGNAFADALLGNFRSYSEAQLDPIGEFRFWQLEAFVSDDWRISRDFSVEVGLRYGYHDPTYTLGNNLTSFDPSAYSAARAVTVNTNGTLVPGSGDRYNGLVRPGDVPADQAGNVPNASSPDVAALPIASHRGFYSPQHMFMPRFSFAWNPGGSGKTAVRGGVGLFYDRPEGNLYFSLANNPPFSLSSSYENGNLANPGGGSASALAPWASIDSLDPNLKIPRSWNWSVSLQRELSWWGLFGEIAYVGSYGQHLLWQPDINAPSFADLAANAAGPKYNTNYLRPYKGYSNIRMRLTDAHSTYHALQVFLSKRRGDLTFTLNYTLSRAYDDASGNGDQTDAAADYHDLAYNWGPSSYDRTHIFVGTWTYSLPFFRENKGVLGYVLGGWEVSGIARYQTGAPLTVTAGSSIGNRRADFVGGNAYVADSKRVDAKGGVTWLNAAAFAAPPEGRAGNSGRDAFRGPAYSVWDISVRKQFRLGKDVRLLLQADLFNAFNQINWGTVDTNMSNKSFGTVTSVNPPRNVQLGARILF
jgi:hypothetical protein